MSLLMSSLWQIFFLIIGLLFITIIIRIIARNVKDQANDSSQPIESYEATVVDKRIDNSYNPNKLNKTSVRNIYYVTFKFQRHNQIELVVSNKEYHKLNKDDKGILNMRAKKYVSFTKEI